MSFLYLLLSVIKSISSLTSARGHIWTLLHPPNLVRIHFLPSCKNAEIFVVISQVVSDLAKISVSVPSISWGVLGLMQECRVSCKKTIDLKYRSFKELYGTPRKSEEFRRILSNAQQQSSEELKIQLLLKKRQIVCYDMNRQTSLVLLYKVFIILKTCTWYMGRKLNDCFINSNQSYYIQCKSGLPNMV